MFNILIVGATGFIGRHLCAELVRYGHKICAGVRDPEVFHRRCPGHKALAIDLNLMLKPENWQPLLVDIDVVINAAGVLQSSPGQDANKIHTLSIKALIEACKVRQVQHFVQISAVSASPDIDTEYATSKRDADQFLMEQKFNWHLLRPSLVYHTGSYGGTSVLRGLAAFPFFTPVIGDGNYVFQPITATDLSKTVVRCLEGQIAPCQSIDVVGPETLTLAEILRITRQWLNLSPVPLLPIPLTFVQFVAKLGDWTQAGPMRSTALKHLVFGNVSDPVKFQQQAGFRPQSMQAFFQTNPSHVQDRWHAKIFFLKPLITLSLCLLWLISAWTGLVNPPPNLGPLVDTFGLSQSFAPYFVGLFSTIDILILLGLLMNWRWIGWVQLFLVAGYTIGLSILFPQLWADTYGPLLKNLPILILIGISIALQDEK